MENFNLKECLARMTAIEKQIASDPTRFDRFMAAHMPKPKPRPSLLQRIRNVFQRQDKNNKV
jgi:hypothetical protein